MVKTFTMGDFCSDFITMPRYEKRTPDPLALRIYLRITWILENLKESGLHNPYLLTSYSFVAVGMVSFNLKITQM